MGSSSGYLDCRKIVSSLFAYCLLCYFDEVCFLISVGLLGLVWWFGSYLGFSFRKYFECVLCLGDDFFMGFALFYLLNLAQRLVWNFLLLILRFVCRLFLLIVERMNGQGGLGVVVVVFELLFLRIQEILLFLMIYNISFISLLSQLFYYWTLYFPIFKTKHWWYIFSKQHLSYPNLYLWYTNFSYSRSSC